MNRLTDAELEYAYDQAKRLANLHYDDSHVLISIANSNLVIIELLQRMLYRYE